MEMILHRFDLPLRHDFRLFHGTTRVHEAVIVELREGEVRGYGEAGTSGYYRVPARRIVQRLQAVQGEVERASFNSPEEFWERMQPLLADESFALCALDQAAHDLWGKRVGEPVWKLWGLTADRCPPTDYTIGLDTVEKMVAKMREFDGWPVYKIKLGTDDDLRIVRELRNRTDAIFRIDANTGWSAEQTIRNSRELAALGVEFIEQPLKADDWQGARRVYETSALPIIADESCIAEPDVARCRGFFHGVNVKLVKAGGLTPARRMVAEARALGLKAMVGCMTESTVGISAAAQLLPMLDYADMDGALLLGRDVAEGVTFDKGKVVYPDTPGCGVTLRDSLPEERDV